MYLCVLFTYICLNLWRTEGLAPPVATGGAAEEATGTSPCDSLGAIDSTRDHNEKWKSVEFSGTQPTHSSDQRAASPTQDFDLP